MVIAAVAASTGRGPMEGKALWGASTSSIYEDPALVLGKNDQAGGLPVWQANIQTSGIGGDVARSYSVLRKRLS